MWSFPWLPIIVLFEELPINLSELLEPDIFSNFSIEEEIEPNPGKLFIFKTFLDKFTSKSAIKPPSLNPSIQSFGLLVAIILS